LNPSLKDRTEDGICLSLAFSNGFEGMSLTELRIEDYHLIRTGGLNSAQQDQIKKSVER
jgi:hypothetical protein